MYTVNEVFNQAKEDSFAGNVDGKGYEARIVYGTKISRDLYTGEVQFFNCTKGGSYYTLLSDEEINIFREKGWRCGVYVLFLSNNRSRLDSLERSIRREVNGENNPSRIKFWKVRRERILQRYNNINLLLQYESN